MTADTDELVPKQEPWRDMVRRLLEGGHVDEDQETVLIRYFSERETALAQTMQRVSEEYRRREASDGHDSATEWMKQIAHDMGREDREDAERMLASIGVSSAA